MVTQTAFAQYLPGRRRILAVFSMKRPKTRRHKRGPMMPERSWGIRGRRWTGMIPGHDRPIIHPYGAALLLHWSRAAGSWTIAAATASS
jgi:hypothetical protein